MLTVFLQCRVPTVVMKYKKFELMLTRCAKAYSSSCLQTVQQFHRSSFLECALQPKIAMVNNDKITNVTGVPLFDALVRRFH